MKTIHKYILFFILCMPMLATASEIESLLLAFEESNSDQKIELIDQMAALKSPETLDVFEALSDGTLYRYNGMIVKRKGEGESQSYHQLSDNGFDKKAEVTGSAKKIRVNNRIRNHLQKYTDELALFHKNATVRRNAINSYIRTPKPEKLALLERAGSQEESSKNQKLFNIAIASIKVNDNSQPLSQISAAKTLADSHEIESYYLLEKLSQQSIANKELKSAVEQAMQSIDQRQGRYKLVENTFFGLSLGSVLLLASIGLAITFGVMGVINMAHGEMIMLGAYCTYVVQLIMPSMIEYSLFVSIPVAFLVCGLVGILIERLVIRHLYGRTLETLLATFGISLILQQAVRSIFSPLNREVKSPDWMSGSLEINSMLSLTYNRLYILVFSLIVLFALILLLKKTSMGLHMRAVTQNRAMANSMGIRSSRVDALTFGLGSGIAGIAGVALSQLTNVGPNLGQSYIVDSFMVVVFGGVGNLLGTLYAAMGLGVATKFLEPYAGAVMAKILILIFIILFIQWRPRGLFAVKGRFVED